MEALPGRRTPDQRPLFLGRTPRRGQRRVEQGGPQRVEHLGLELADRLGHQALRRGAVAGLELTIAAEDIDLGVEILDRALTDCR